MAESENDPLTEMDFACELTVEYRCFFVTNCTFFIRACSACGKINGIYIIIWCIAIQSSRNYPMFILRIISFDELKIQLRIVATLGFTSNQYVSVYQSCVNIT